MNIFKTSFHIKAQPTTFWELQIESLLLCLAQIVWYSFRMANFMAQRLTIYVQGGRGYFLKSEFLNLSWCLTAEFASWLFLYGKFNFHNGFLLRWNTSLQSPILLPFSCFSNHHQAACTPGLWASSIIGSISDRIIHCPRKLFGVKVFNILSLSQDLWYS